MIMFLRGSSYRPHSLFKLLAGSFICASFFSLVPQYRKGPLLPSNSQYLIRKTVTNIPGLNLVYNKERPKKIKNIFNYLKRVPGTSLDNKSKNSYVYKTQMYIYPSRYNTYEDSLILQCQLKIRL